MTSSYRLSVVSISLSAAVGHNYEYKVAACSHHSRAPNYRNFSVDCSVQYNRVAMTCSLWDCSHSGKSISFRDLKLDDGLRTSVQSAHPGNSWVSCFNSYIIFTFYLSF